MKRALRLLVAVVLVASLAGAARADDPARTWRTIDTPHFWIHFYTLPHGGGEEPVAQRLATVTEYVYSRLTPVLGRGLGRKTHVVITDDIDDYNGFAGVYPYPAVTLYANSPDDRAELNDYDDWLTDLFMHEYTHVLHTGTIGGVCAKAVNACSASGRRHLSAESVPAALGPEGLAVFEETTRALRRAACATRSGTCTCARDARGKFQRSIRSRSTPNQFPSATRLISTARR